MLEILLMGLVLVVVYMVSHVVVLRLEAWHGKPLGGMRTVAFFCIFLVLTLASMSAMQWFFGGI